jgi:hypothetical protein
MPRPKLAIFLRVAASLACAIVLCPANAAVIIKTFDFSICVTGTKQPDGCKSAGADAHVVVTDEQMEHLDGKIGQGATIAAIPKKGEPLPQGGKGLHQHHHQGPDSPGM